MFILGITGRKRTGKDTVCQIVKEHFAPNKVVRISFADALKEEIGLAVGQTVSYIETHKDNFRLILQGWGTDFRRKLCSEDYWIEKWLSKVNHAPVNCCGIVATDVRFQNEANAIRQLGGMMWRVERPDLKSDDAHASETELSKVRVDDCFVNDGSVEQLTNKIKLSLTTWKV